MAKSEPTNIYPVHVICCNDAMVFVVVGTYEQALKRLEAEAQAAWSGCHKYHYPDKKTYRELVHWGIYTVHGEMYEPL